MDLVNNAARFTRIPVLESPRSDWDFIHSVNLKAAFFCAQQAALLMKRRAGGEGRIVIISSMGAFLAWPDHVHYCASKAGVVSLTRNLAKALAPGITVNSVAPGVIPFEEKDDPRIVAMAAGTPAGRPGTGDDIADAVVYFLKATNIVTGQVLQVDGGLGLESENVPRLMRMDRSCILMHMRTTLIIEDGLLDRAREISGISEKTAVVRAGLEALIAREAAKRLAALGGTERKLRCVQCRDGALGEIVMVLVDTSVWIDHLRRNDPASVSLLAGGEVLAHPFVIGELAAATLGIARPSSSTCRRFRPPAAPPISRRLGSSRITRLWGRGIGWVDCAPSGIDTSVRLRTVDS